MAVDHTHGTYIPGDDSAHPGEPHQFIRQWNRFSCGLPNCIVKKTQECGIEYQDQMGRIDPYSIDANLDDVLEAPLPKQTPEEDMIDAIKQVAQAVDAITSTDNPTSKKTKAKTPAAVDTADTRIADFVAGETQEELGATIQ